MFQGSRHVAKAEHIALIQAAGGTMNGTTWLDRTNYFETLPSHQLDLGLWFEADRMATLLDALSQENLDNQREVVKNEKRWSYDNRPYGSWQEKLQAHLFPPDHPYHHSTIGSMEDLDAASLDDVKAFFQTYYAPNNAVLSVVGDVDTDAVRASVERYFGAIPANPSIPPLRDLSLPPTLGREIREVVKDRVPLPRIYVGFRAPVFGDHRLDALEVAGQILAGGKGSRLHRRLVRDERIAQDVALFALGFVGGASVAAGWATVRPGISVDRVEAAFHEELERLAVEPVSDDELARARALIEADELGGLQRVEERADRLSMYATLFDRPALINEMLGRYLAVTPEAILEVVAATFRPDNRLVLDLSTGYPERRERRDRPRRGRDPGRGGSGMTAERTGDVVVAERPAPGTPRPYAFPSVTRSQLENGLTILVVDMPGRPLVSAVLIMPVGAVDEPASMGVRPCSWRAPSPRARNGTTRSSLTEAAERLGASLHAEAGWDATSIGVDVPSTRLEPALELLAEVLLHPTFPAAEIDRLRDERLNDLLQAQADPRRRADETFIGTIYAPTAPYHRPAAGTRETVERLDDVRGTTRLRTDPRPGPGDPRRRRRSRWAGRRRSHAAIARQLDESTPAQARRRRSSTRRRHRDVWSAWSIARAASRPRSASATAGCPAAIPDYHAVTVMGAILGGLFNSRLNMQLREAKGYTYGAGRRLRDATRCRPVHGQGRRQHRGHRPGSRRHDRRVASACVRRG